MTPSEIVQSLRSLADRFEALGIDDSTKITGGVRLGLFHIETREHLAKLLPLVDRPRLNDEVPCIGPGTCCDGCEVTLFYEPGLLGGERKEIFVAMQSDVDALLAERVGA